MSRTQTYLEEVVSIPLTKEFRGMLEKLAENDQRKLAQMARILLERAAKDEAEKQGVKFVPAA